MTEELKLLEEWQKRLRMQDWFISLEYPCTNKDLIGEADGDVEYVESTKCAHIRIIDPETREGSLRPFDLEEILVHELLHCKFALLTNGEDWDNDLHLRILHQLIDDTARALVDAKKERKTK